MLSTFHNKTVLWARKASRSIQVTIINSLWEPLPVESYFHQVLVLLGLMDFKMETLNLKILQEILEAQTHIIILITVTLRNNGPTRTTLRQVSIQMDLRTCTQGTSRNWISRYIQIKIKLDIAMPQISKLISTWGGSYIMSKSIQIRFKKHSKAAKLQTSLKQPETKLLLQQTPFRAKETPRTPWAIKPFKTQIPTSKSSWSRNTMRAS